MKVNGKVVVVTGGGNGIGRELVLALLARGARVAAVDVNEQALQETMRLAGQNAPKMAVFVANITDRPAVLALPQQVIACFGAVDAVINNAGIIQPFVRLENLDDAAVERVMNVNFYGTLFMIQAFLPHLRARPAAHIVNTSSMGGFLPVPGQTLYGASKAAVKLLTEGLHAELAGSPVRVTLVLPGAIATNIAANSGVAVREAAGQGAKAYPTTPATEAARIILNAVEQNQYRVLVGADARFMDLLYRVNPRRAAAYIAKKMQGLLPAA